MMTLVLSPRFSEDSNRLWNAAVQMHWKVQRAESYRELPELTSQEIVIYGESLFVMLAAEAYGLAVIEPTFGWLADLPADYRLRAVRYTILGEARKQTQPAFVKPADGKGFDAKIYRSGIELPAPYLWSDDTPVLTSEPVRWQLEYRFFVLERTVATASMYLDGGELAQSEDGHWYSPPEDTTAAHQFCEKLLSDPSVSMPPAFVLDIGKIPGRGWAVIEANPACASGIYGCAPDKVLTVLRRACVAQDVATPVDRLWVVDRTN